MFKRKAFQHASYFVISMSPSRKESSHKRVPPYDIKRERPFVEYIIRDTYLESGSIYGQICVSNAKHS